MTWSRRGDTDLLYGKRVLIRGATGVLTSLTYFINLLNKSNKYFCGIVGYSFSISTKDLGWALPSQS